MGNRQKNSENPKCRKYSNVTKELNNYLIKEMMLVMVKQNYDTGLLGKVPKKLNKTLYLFSRVQINTDLS